MEEKRVSENPLSAVPFGVQEFIAGTFGGWAQVVVGHPFDTLKVRMQTQPTPPIYKNTIHCLQTTIKNEGLAGLYKGVASPMMGIGFCNAVVFAANGEFRKYLSEFRGLRSGDDLSLFDKALAGGLAGGVMSLLNCPVELLKVKLQTQTHLAKPLYTGVFDCGVKTVRSNGFAGLYRGFPITFLRDIPSFYAYFGTYEYLKQVFNENSRENTPMELFLSGGFAGISAWLVCYPQDIIKSRMQMDYKHSSMFAAISALKAEAKVSGYKIYLRGFAPTIARAFPANAATFMAYEYAKKMFE
ncbi:hypothetical protein BB559_000534 [Furculomyces boomerangus]|uniref:Mitochondrial carrier protein n=1 Tax=Furculomyces boomerangus TaxID=61424 RepID=A0A2T9Z4Z2_9FUNG|nr:hypothetical protein BB559_000534 [Furculomyces boomerangus]